MDLDFMVDKAVNNILSVSGKSKTTQVIRDEFEQVIKLARQIGYLEGKEDELSSLSQSLGKHGI